MSVLTTKQTGVSGYVRSYNVWWAYLIMLKTPPWWRHGLPHRSAWPRYRQPSPGVSHLRRTPLPYLDNSYVGYYRYR